MEIVVAQFVVFILAFLRITSLIVVAPILGNQTVPVPVKLALGAFMAYVLMPLLIPYAPAAETKLAGFAVLALKEVFVGLVLGFAAGLLFAGLRYAGEFMAFVMGLSIASVYDPESAQNIPIIGELMYLFGILLFLVLNGHHFVLEALALSFRTAPLGGVEIAQPFADKLVALAGLVFVIAAKLAAPVVVAAFLTSVSLGVLARVMPQANMMIVSFPINISVGLIVIAASTPFIVFVFKKLLIGFEENILELIRVM